MTKLYSYVLRFDDGAAPNPFWGMCTLTICKQAIRRKAEIGDWVIGTGSKNTQLKRDVTANLSDCIVYAMKITGKKTLKEYDTYCKEYLKNKIPNWRTNAWPLRMGDCIYDFSNSQHPVIRKSVHNEANRERDLSGKYALLSNHFYYFGEAARPLPLDLQSVIKQNQGHLVITQQELVTKFEHWIKQFIGNYLYGNPQLRWEFDKINTEASMSKCSSCHYTDDLDESEEVVC